MTSRALVPVDTDTLERMAFDHHVDIETDNANARAFLRIGSTTFVAELEQEPTC